MEFLTVEEFAKKIKMCRHSVLRAIKKGKIYATRPSGSLRGPFRIAESELERLQIQAMCMRKTNE